MIGMGDGGPNTSPPNWFWRPGTSSGGVTWSSDPNLRVDNANDAARGSDQWGYRRAALYPYAPNTDMVHCPADLRWRLSGNDIAYRSFAGAGGLSDFKKTTDLKHPADRFLWIEENDVRTVSATVVKTSYIFGENLGTWSLISGTPDPPVFQAVKDAGWRDAPAAFHGNSCTLSWADGHATPKRWLSNYTIQFANNPTAGRAGAFTKDGLWQNDLLYIANAYAFYKDDNANWP